MADKIELKDVDIDDLIEEIERRGHDVDHESNIDDFSDAELREALGLDEDDHDIDWNELYNKIQTGSEEVAIRELKSIIEQRTGRILT